MRMCRRLLLVFVLLALPPLLPSDRVPPRLHVEYQVRALVNGREFSLFLWEVDALADKVRDILVDPARAYDEDEARELVLDYVRTAWRVASLEREITRLASGAGAQAVTEGTDALQAQVDELRQVQAARRPAVEAILEDQTAAVLKAEQLTTLGQLWPPVKFRFSDPPLYLVISPRPRIATRLGVHLQPDLALSAREALEQATDQVLADYVSLVEDLGGFGTYPTMILDNATLSWILDTIAHEWAHNYLAFRPLGWHYFDNSDTITLNETVASIVGEEIGARLLERFYPDQVAPRQPTPSERRPAHSPQDAPPAFDFNSAMRETRLRVDELLAEGGVTEAEAYMEERRKLFVEEGYALRKLNQAYFAFHGSYATAPGSVDPIGPKMTQLRSESPSLRAFLATVSGFTHPEQLDEALATLNGS